MPDCSSLLMFLSCLVTLIKNHEASSTYVIYPLEVFESCTHKRTITKLGWNSLYIVYICCRSLMGLHQEGGRILIEKGTMGTGEKIASISISCILIADNLFSELMSG